MDTIREPYTTWMRFGTDLSQSVKVQWRFCQPTALSLGFETPFVSRGHDVGEIWPDIGEVQFDERKKTPWVAVSHLPGTHDPCGDPAVWADGYPGTVPPDYPLNVFGHSLCCAGPMGSAMIGVLGYVPPLPTAPIATLRGGLAAVKAGVKNLGVLRRVPAVPVRSPAQPPRPGLPGGGVPAERFRGGHGTLRTVPILPPRVPASAPTGQVPGYGDLGRQDRPLRIGGTNPLVPLVPVRVLAGAPVSLVPSPLPRVLNSGVASMLLSPSVFSPAPSPPTAAPIIVRSTATFTGTPGIGATFVPATTTGNLLVYLIQTVGGSTCPTPSGLTLLGSASSGLNTTFVFYQPNAPSTTTQNFATGSGAVLFALEISGANAVAPLDQMAINSGSGSTADTTATSSITSLDQLAIAFFAGGPIATSFSSPTNGFAYYGSNADVGFANWNTICQKTLTSVATVSCATTADLLTSWVAIMSTWRA